VLAGELARVGSRVGPLITGHELTGQSTGKSVGMVDGFEIGSAGLLVTKIVGVELIGAFEGGFKLGLVEIIVDGLVDKLQAGELEGRYTGILSAVGETVGKKVGFKDIETV